MQPFTTHTGTAAVLWRENVDTDQIIPKDFLKSIKRTGFGTHLFEDWRYLPDGKENPDFELNQPRAQGASILVTGNNFGCGSSREHAVWAVMQYGFRAVIAPFKERDGQVVPGFADIFRGNALKNGLLTVELPLSDVMEIQAKLVAHSGIAVTIDLARQSLSIGELAKTFAIDAGVKDTLLRGLDDIGRSLEDVAAIAAFEKCHDPQMRNQIS